MPVLRTTDKTKHLSTVAEIKKNDTKTCDCTEESQWDEAYAYSCSHKEKLYRNMKSFLGDFFLGKATLFLGEAILFRLMYMPRNIESKDF